MHLEHYVDLMGLQTSQIGKEELIASQLKIACYCRILQISGAGASTWFWHKGGYRYWCPLLHWETLILVHMCAKVDIDIGAHAKLIIN